jgi:hypothetical protein
MSTFSATSPRITEDDERKERESMAPEEIAEIEQDIRGTGESVIKETDEMKRQAAVQLEEAIDMIPENEKIAYLRALELCPELVGTESKSIHFLRCENYNPWVSIGYWLSMALVYRTKKPLGCLVTHSLIRYSIFVNLIRRMQPSDWSSSGRYGERSLAKMRFFP